MHLAGYSPVRLSVEEGTWRVDVNHLAVDEGTVPLLGILRGKSIRNEEIKL